MKKRTRIKKPRDFRFGRLMHWPVPSQYVELDLEAEAINLKEAKRLYAWLGKAIQYLEQEKK